MPLPRIHISVRTLVLGLLLQACGAPAQLNQSTPRLLATLPEPAAAFTTDPLNHLYLITPDNTLIKYDADGRELFRFSDNTLGTLAHLDASNPFRLLLFYPDMQQVRFLDRTLAPIGSLDLGALGFWQVPALALSSDNQLWLYDPRTFQLKKLDARGKVLLHSSDLQLLLGQAPQPTFLLEARQTVFLLDPARGIHLFDLFGQYLKTLPLQGLRRFQVLDERLIYRNPAGRMEAFHLQSLLTQTLSLPEGLPPFEELRFGKGRLFLLHQRRLHIFDWNP